MKSWRFRTLGTAALGLVIGGIGVGVGYGQKDQEISAVAAPRNGLSLSPLPLNLKGKNRALVAQGSYIVNALGGCNDCHTSPAYLEGGDPFRGEPEQINALGYLRGGESFGPFVSRNLRPEIGTNLPAGLTLRQFITVMRTGVDLELRHPQISPLLQVMPWPVYRKMTDNDLRAIYEYLRALPPVPGPA